jgi:NADPH:quinone reductase-like Zn-dependent oxidoreductase
LDLRRAGAIPVTGLTALQGIDDTLKLKRGERIIIHGASGGVGTMAVQFAKLRGAKVFATASGKDGAALVRRLGVDVAIDGRSDDLPHALLKFAPDGADALLVFADGQTLKQCLDAVRHGGRVAYPNGVEPAPRKRAGIKVTSYDAAVGVREFDRLNRAISAAGIKVPIAAEFPLAQAAKAHQRLNKGHILGKVILRIR